MRFLCLWSLLSINCLCSAQVIIRIQPNLKLKHSLYLAGSFNGWNPADSNFIFLQTPIGYELSLSDTLCKKGLLCKVTQGSWQICEGNVSGGAINNRIIPPVSDTVLVFTVQGWEQPHQENHTVSSRVVSHILDYNGYTRRVWVYLPMGYDSKVPKSYPVLYLLDGQNIFDEVTSFSGEWGVDETMERIEQEGGRPSIVVAIDQGGEQRLTEYSPFANLEYGGGGGQLYAEYLVKDVKPFIDSAYRTSPGFEYTGIGGSSLGGLLAAYVSIQYPQIFGKVAVFSPSFWWSDSLNILVKSVGVSPAQKWCVMAGIHESSRMQSDIDTFCKLLLEQGANPQNVLKQMDFLGKHDEIFWSRIFKPAYCWLFDGGCNTSEVKIDQQKHLLVPMKKDIKEMLLLNQSGQTLKVWKNPEVGTKLKTGTSLRGYYLLRSVYPDHHLSEVFVYFP